MYQLNYFTLRALTWQLNQRLAGGRVLQAFSQDRDVLTLLVKPTEGKAFYVQAAFTPRNPYVAPLGGLRRARKNVANVLQGLVGCGITGVSLVPLERLLVLHLDEGEPGTDAAPPTALVLQLHGSRGNAYLWQAGRAGDRFRHDLPEPQPNAALVSWLAEHRSPEQVADAWAHLLPAERTFFTEAHRAVGNDPAPEALRTALPMLDEPLARWAAERMGTGLALHGALAPLLALPSRDEWFVGVVRGKLGLYLLPAEDLPPVQGLFMALEKWLRLVLRGQAQRNLREAVQKQLDTRLAQAERKLHTARRTLHQLTTERDPEELGHLLLAHAGLWQPGLTSLTVEDAYREGQPLTLTLDPALNLQENAERYYAKHREQQARRTAAEQHQAQAERELDELEPAVAEWPAVTNWKQLQAFLGRYPQLLSQQGAGALKADEPLPYRETVFQGYRIRVGRNAKANDLLTLRHSRKADWWLHARDGNGAHVVVVARHATEPPPRPVLEHAAALAAGHSQAQHSALVPVVYTQVKFLRKRKGFAPGKVLYDRADTLLVEPRKV